MTDELIYRDGVVIIGHRRKKIAPTQLITIPPFIRFKKVQLLWNFGAQPIVENWFESHLLPIRPALSDSILVEFYVTIAQSQQKHFSDHSMLLEHIQNRWLSICNSSRGYKFGIVFLSDRNSATNVIASLLQMHEIKRCSHVEIIAKYSCECQLPVEVVSNWLELGDEAGKKFQNEERFLAIDIGNNVYYSIENARELYDHLKTVFLKTFIF